MLSKITEHSIAWFLLISSVNALPMDTGNLDQRTVSFDSAAGCARCIRGGYTFVYQDADTATKSGQTVAASGSYDTKNVCCNGLNCGDSDLSKQSGQLLSSHFNSLDVALFNCPHKIDVCGAKSQTLAKVADKVTVSVSTTKAMTQADSCHWEVKVTCGIPQVELTTLGGVFASGTTAGLAYIEYLEAPNISSVPSVFDNQSDYEIGELHDLWKGKYIGDVNAQGINLGGKGGILVPVPGFMVEKLIKEANTDVDSYITAAKKFKTDLIEYQANLVDRAKVWIWRNYGRPSPDDEDGDGPPRRGQRGPGGFVGPGTGGRGGGNGGDGDGPGGGGGGPQKHFADDTPCPVPPVLPQLYKGLTAASASFKGGYGSLTAGQLTLKASDKKFFGVLGQGTGTDKGFIYPLETADKCITKYIGLSLYPIVADGATLSTTSSDTFTATITSTNAAVHTLDPSVSTANKKDIMGGKAINDALQKLSLNFRAYDQWQYKAEYLSAQTVSLGVAAISSFAALTLY